MARGILLDVEGVLLEGNRPVPGAREALAFLRSADVGVRFLTNTTTRARVGIAESLRAAGLGAEDTEVISPALAAGGMLRQRGIARVHLAADPSLAQDLGEVELVGEAPEAVVLGDLHRGFDWDRLDRIFGMMREGALLVALHRNRVCRREGRIALDLGPFVAALEYAAGVEAVTVGKPEAGFFARAIESLGVGPGEAIMIGDDIEADIGGALAAGLRAVQVRTGKYTPRDEEEERPRPSARIGSIAELPECWESLW